MDIFLSTSFSLGSNFYLKSDTTITNCRRICGTATKSHTTITRHQEDNLSKATSSLLPIKTIAKLEWTESITQNIEQLQNPTMGETINNESTTTEPPP